MRPQRSGLARAGSRAISLVAALILAACDLSPTNPGPVQDDALDRPSAHPALVSGMARALSRAVNWIAYTSGAVTMEIASAGGTSVFGISLLQRQGVLDPASAEADVHWQYAQQARWVAEDGVRRMRRVLGNEFASSALGGEALVYVGFANRLLGENMCQAVIDGGPAEPRTVFLARAEAAFTEVLAMSATLDDAEIAHAARAGRASVRASLGNWAGAVEDARLVPPAFVFAVRNTDVEQDQYNRIYWANSNQPYRNHTVYGTFYESYYETTGDPRASWARDPAVPTGSSNIPWYFQTKYTSKDAPIALVSEREMRLLLAEAVLRDGGWQTAIDAINALRAETGVGPWTVTGVDETWSALKRERGIEFWLEGRRLGDLQRWLAEGVPGQAEDMTDRSTCFPIGRTELDANPNLGAR